MTLGGSGKKGVDRHPKVRFIIEKLKKENVASKLCVLLMIAFDTDIDPFSFGLWHYFTFRHDY